MPLQSHRQAVCSTPRHYGQPALAEGDGECGFLSSCCYKQRRVEDLGAQILGHSSQVHWSTSANTLTIAGFTQKSVDTTSWELKPCSG